MINIHLDDFVTNCIIFSLCWLVIAHGIVLICKAWIFWQERKILLAQKHKIKEKME